MAVCNLAMPPKHFPPAASLSLKYCQEWPSDTNNLTSKKVKIVCYLHAALYLFVCSILTWISFMWTRLISQQKHCEDRRKLNINNTLCILLGNFYNIWRCKLLQNFTFKRLKVYSIFLSHFKEVINGQKYVTISQCDVLLRRCSPSPTDAVTLSGAGARLDSRHEQT